MSVSGKTIIEVRCKGNRTLPYREFKTFQGNLKNISKENFTKLKNSILKFGWIAPVFVWNKNEILDGHGRLLVLDDLVKENYTIAEIPVVDIEAKTKKEAAQILLSINSKYQEITEEGLSEFMQIMDLSITELDDINISDIDMTHFTETMINYDPPETMIPEFGDGLSGDTSYIISGLTEDFTGVFLDELFKLTKRYNLTCRETIVEKS